MKNRLNSEQVQWLHDRWKGDITNKIIIALNEGRSLDPILKKLKKLPDIPNVDLRLDLRYIDLSHQNLRGPWKKEGDRRVRSGVNLQNADLTGANLTWVIMPCADLTNSLLYDANLQSAELIHSDFTKADLTGADLSGAWLLGTKFHFAKVTEVQLQSRRNLGQMDFDYHAFEI